MLTVRSSVVLSCLVLIVISFPSYRVRAAEPVTRTRLHKLRFASAAYGAGGRLLAIGVQGGGITLWNEKAGDQARELAPGSFWGFNFAFTPDGARLYMPGSRGLLTCRDLKSGNPISTGLVRNARCDAVALDAHGKIIATGQGHEVDLWSLETGLHLRSLKAHPYCTSVSLAFSPDGSLLISSGVPPPDEETRGQVVIWRVVDGVELLRQEGGADVVGFCKDGKEFATQEGGEIRVKDTETGRIVWTRTGDEVSTSALSQMGSRLIIGTTKGVVEVWDPVRRNLVLRKRVGDAPIVAVAVADEGKKAVCVDVDEQVTIWNLKEKSP